MTDSVQIFPPGHRITDANDDPIATGTLEFYDAGTTTPRTVYSNSGLSTSLGTIIALDAGGYPTSDGNTKVLVYTGVTAYKIIAKNSSGATVWTHDNIKGAVDTAAFLTGANLVLGSPVVSTSIDLTLAASHKGKLIDVNCTGADRQITLTSALTLGDGWRAGIRHAGTANQVNIVTSLSQTIDGPGFSNKATALVGRGETVWLSCDGSGFKIDSYAPQQLMGGTGLIEVADRLSTPPGAPQSGAYYIVTAAPTGAWSAYAQHDLVRADGQGTWIKQTPPTDCGWLAYVQDEDSYYAFIGSVWVEKLLRAATQAEMEAATAATPFVTPAVQHHHPGHPKMWGVVTWAAGTPTLQTSYNVTSIADTALGRLTVTLATAFANANWAPFGMAERTTAGGDIVIVSSGTKAAGSVEFAIVTDGGSLDDPVSMSFMGLGDMP